MEVVPRCEVLDRDAVGREHPHPVRALESAVDHWSDYRAPGL